MMSSYAYQSLTSGESGAANQIRLLTILPGPENSDIRCKLTVVSLQQATNNDTYETLSYTWGPAPPTKWVILEDDEAYQHRFDVRENLYFALSAFRFEDRPRMLWTDAICINQLDDGEKSAQIPLMRRIYEGSMQTLIWLGPGTADTAPAMALARSLSAAWMACGGQVAKIPMFNSGELRARGLPSLFSTDYVKLLTMLEQPWFGRAWVVQEVTVSKSSVVYWGTESIEWQQLVFALDFATRAEMPFALHPAMNRFVPLAEEAAIYRAGGCRLLSVLLRHRPCAAEKPEDKVYAFLGLTEKGEGNFISLGVRYEQPMSTFYADVARKIAEHEHSLDVLSHPAAPFRTTIPGLPTWVPDWSPAVGAALRQIVHAEVVSLTNSEQAGRNKWVKLSASKGTPYAPKETSQGGVLIVEGHKIDELRTVMPRYESVYLPPNKTEIGSSVISVIRAKNVFMEWEDSMGLPELSCNAPKYPTGEDLIDAFYQTLMIGNIEPGEDKTKLREEYLAWSRVQRPVPILNRLGLGSLQTAISAVKTLATSAITQDSVATFNKRVKEIVFRKFVRTRKGYMGLCAGDPETGDEIWLCKGSKVPLVLRPTGHGNRFTFVGDAYVHGIMYGEAFDETKCVEIALV